MLSDKFCVIFNHSLATPLVESIHKRHKKQEKNKKAETPCSPHNVPTSALGSPYFHKDALKANSFRIDRHQGLKLTTFSWLPFPQILHPWCLLPDCCLARRFVFYYFFHKPNDNPNQLFSWLSDKGDIVVSYPLLLRL